MHENLTHLSLIELRQIWAKAWDTEPHAKIGRMMLEKSLTYKKRGKDLTSDQQKRLEQLVRQYKRNPNCFDENVPVLKPGTRIVRNWNGVWSTPIIESMI